jgi:hypothetical protein
MSLGRAMKATPKSRRPDEINAASVRMAAVGPEPATGRGGCAAVLAAYAACVLADVRPRIGRVLPLAQAGEALRLTATGETNGTVVLRVGD